MDKLIQTCLDDLRRYWRGADNSIKIAEDLDELIAHLAVTNPAIKGMVLEYNAKVQANYEDEQTKQQEGGN